MPNIYNYPEEGKCLHCNKLLKDADQTGGWMSRKGNQYGFKLYCSYRCINDAGTKRAKERRKQSMKGLTCLHCEKVFDGKRKDTKFCSIKSRVAAWRKTNENLL